MIDVMWERSDREEYAQDAPMPFKPEYFVEQASLHAAGKASDIRLERRED
ncbi:MAG: hypothetical protein R6V44_16340 [Paracoccaceae bacterium]